MPETPPSTVQLVFSYVMEGIDRLFQTPLYVWLVLMILLAVLGRVPFQYNLRNLGARWPTTALTALAFTLVIALLTVMMAFVNGMNGLTENSGRPGNVVVLSEGATDEVFSNIPLSDAGEIELQPGVLRDPETNAPLASKETYMIVNQPIKVAPSEAPRRRFVQVRGVEDPRLSSIVHAMTLQAGGSWFTEAGVRDLPRESASASGGVETDTETCIEAVLGEGIATEIGSDRPEKKPLAMGDRFEIGGRKWVAVGILESAGATFDSEVWAKRGLVGPIFGKTTYTSLVLRTSDDATAEKMAEMLKKEFKKSNLDAQPEVKYFARLGETSKQFAYSIGFVTFVMAVGGMFGIMNTMFAAISQRIKDIAVLRIVGFSRLQVLMSFLLESLTLALLGGLLGCAIGMLCDGLTAKSIISAGQGAGSKFVVLKLNVDWAILLLGMRVALWMGLLGGLLPSFSAMRLRPLESMR